MEALGLEARASAAETIHLVLNNLLSKPLVPGARLPDDNITFEHATLSPFFTSGNPRASVTCEPHDGRPITITGGGVIRLGPGSLFLFSNKDMARDFMTLSRRLMRQNPRATTPDVVLLNPREDDAVTRFPVYLSDVALQSLSQPAMLEALQADWKQQSVAVSTAAR